MAEHSSAPGMEEAARRLESGEDPEKVEEDMGDLFGGDEDSPEESLAPAMGEHGRRASLKSLRRRLLPPAHDQRLYPLE